MAKAERFEGTYQVIEDFWVEHGYSPNVREVQRMAGLSSTSVTAYHIRHLVKAGLVAWVPRIDRTVRPLNFGEHWSGGRLHCGEVAKTTCCGKAAGERRRDGKG